MSGVLTAPKTYTAGDKLTKAEMDTYQRDNILYLKTHIALEEAGALTIAGGVITVTQGYHKVAGEGAAADDLNTISGGLEGMIIFLCPNGQDITLKDGVGNLELGGDILLVDADDNHVGLIYDADGKWHVIHGQTLSRKFMVNCFQYPAPGTDWTPTITGAYLAASKTDKKCWLPLNFLKIGDIITTYNLVGDIILATAPTLNCKLVRVNLADGLTTTDITNGAITELDTDGDFDSTANLDDETVATDKQYLLEIEGTTGAGDSIYVMGAEVTIIRKL